MGSMVRHTAPPIDDDSNVRQENLKENRVVFTSSMSISHLNPNLPSLNALRTFDALARTASVTAAARALSVTQGAVSHQISLLEEWFGKELVRRQGRGLVLTEIGQELAGSVREAFAGLEEACGKVMRDRTNDLDLAAPASFLAHWLVPRLEDLETSHPGLRLRLRTDGGFDDLLAGRLDALIACEVAPWPRGTTVVEIAVERIGPVCVRKWSAKAGSPDWQSTVPRLATDSRPEAWRDWSRARGLPSPRGRIRRFDHLVPLLEAARAGLGVAMVPELIARRYVQEGSLLAPCGFVDGPRRFVLAFREDRADAGALQELAAWFRGHGKAPATT